MAKTSLLLISFFWLCSCGAQNSSVKQYKDAVFVDGEIWGLTQTGEIKVFTLAGNVQRDKAKTVSKALAIAKDNQGDIVVADSANNIISINAHTSVISNIGKTGSRIYGLVVTGSNQLFALTQRGIEDISTHKAWLPDSSIRHTPYIKPGYFGRPYSWFVDSKDLIWIGFDLGEWGGDLLIFDVAKKQFVQWRIKQRETFIQPVKSIAEADGTMYISTSVDHMMIFSRLLKMSNYEASILFDSSDFIEVPGNKNHKNDSSQLVGPCIFNKYDQNLYFYSDKGFFKGDPKTDLSKLGTWQNILKPKLHWIFGQPKAAGYPMNVTKFEFLDKDKFYFVSLNDGIGYYDGQKLTMLF